MATLEEALALARAHHRAGRLDLAELVYRQILAAAPQQADALHLLGVIAHQTGQHALAVERIRQAIAVRPADAAFHSNLAEAHRALGQWTEAVACCRQALVLRPDYAEAHNNLGLALDGQGEWDEALVHYRRAVELKPTYAEAHYNLGVALQARNQPAAAAACYRQALRCRPDYAAACHNLGVALAAQGQLSEAIACYQQALRLSPADAEAHYNLGRALQEQRHTAEAIACYRRAVELDPSLVAAHRSLGGALKFQGQLTEAQACYRQALALNPNDAAALNDLGTIFQDLGDATEAATCFREARRLQPTWAWLHSNELANLQYRPDVTLAALHAAHAEFERQHAAPLVATWRPFPNEPDPERPLRLGFVSPHLAQHPVGFFLIRALENLDRAACTVTCYSDRMHHDALTARFRAAATRWRDVLLYSDERLTAQIRDDRIDILFDLAGHTGGNRLLVFARKPAPVQITWLDYEGTTGLAAIDYLLADRYEVPPAAEGWYCEHVLRMPDDFVCYDPPAAAPPVGPLPARENGRVTLASFNLPTKINGRVVDLWAEILRRLPEARLCLKYRGLDDPAATARFHRQFAERGIAPQRVLLEGWSPYAEFLARYQQVDIALDTFPYSGGLTTCEALWMGVPVITWPGETFASRHGLSHLTNVGLTELIAGSAVEYVELAVRLAQDLSRLAALRAGLRQQVAASPLCDGKRFAANLLHLLRGVWRDWCRGL
jgi:protein O-GlcNAc transferase